MMPLYIYLIFHQNDFLGCLFKAWTFVIGQPRGEGSISNSQLFWNHRMDFDRSFTDSFITLYHCAPLILFFLLNDFWGFLRQDMDFVIGWPRRNHILICNSETAKWILMKWSHDAIKWVLLTIKGHSFFSSLSTKLVSYCLFILSHWDILWNLCILNEIFTWKMSL